MIFNKCAKCLKSPSAYNGFTLLEMLIAMTLITGCMALCFLSWKGIFQRTTLSTTTTLLLNSFEEARLNALQKHAQTWVVFQHSAQGDCYCTLQRDDKNTIHPLTVWITLPATVTLELTPDSVIATAPSEEVIQALPQSSSKGEEKPRVISYNEQGAIMLPENKTTSLHLDLISHAKNGPLREEIIFSRTTGRAFRKN